jgi:hypothetical protein
VGCDVPNHVTRTHVTNVRSCTDSQRTRHSSLTSVGIWDEGQRRWRARFDRSIAVALSQAQSIFYPPSFPCWRRHPSLRMSRACLQGSALPAPVCNEDVRWEYSSFYWTKIRGRSTFNGCSAQSCTISLGRHIGPAARSSFDARHDRLSSWASGGDGVESSLFGREDTSSGKRTKYHR